MKNYTELSYTVLFELAEEGGYIAFVPALPGCMTQGETFEEAKKIFKMPLLAISKYYVKMVMMFPLNIRNILPLRLQCQNTPK